MTRDNNGKFSEAFPNRQAQHTGPVQRRKVLGGIINDDYRPRALSYAT